jgi:hypothetical protein
MGIMSVSALVPLPSSKIIFLDIDGVLITPNQVRPNLANPYCVDALNWLVKESGAALVVTSHWRIRGYGYVRDMFRNWRIEAEIFAMTPMMSNLEEGYKDLYMSAGKGAEILTWLNECHNHYLGRVEQFVILDDERGEMGNLLPFLVQTHWESGLTMIDAKRALGRLTGTGDEWLW